MNKALIFFYGLIIFTVLITGVVSYVVANIKESKKTKINHSNYGCG